MTEEQSPRWFGSIPDFDPDNDWLDPRQLERLAPWIEAMAPWFRPTYHGIENIPREGGALMVGNHGVWYGFDAFFLFFAVWRKLGRIPRGLGDHILFVVPPVGKFWRRLGSVHGTPENALKFLRAGHLLNTYPGGAREGVKERHQRYRLQWDRSFGFVRLALRAQVPIVLHAGIGVDDVMHILGNVPTGRLVGHSKYVTPLWLGWGPLPRPVKLTYYFSEPIRLEGGAEAADDDALVKHHHRYLWKRAQAMLDEGLRKRRSVWFG